MGYAIRTGEFFNMDLCSVFWKSILGIEKDKKDLEKFDKYCMQFLDNIEYTNDEESFLPFTEYKFTTNLTNGTEVELCENGSNKNLSLKNKKEFIELLLKARLNEGNAQIQSIRNGLEEVIPFGILKLLSWNELEMLVCGKPILDIELLKENTQYSGCSLNDKLIQNFWKCLEEFSAEDLIPLKEGLITEDHIKGSIGDLVLGKVKGRESETEITLFDSLGLAVEDVICADYLYRADQ